MYPNAKFIFIHRNPYEVVQSTFNFYKSILPPLQLQSIDDKKLMESILSTYNLMIKKFYIDKKNLNSKNLMEITYTDLTKNPDKIVESIYKDLLHDDFNKIAPDLKKIIKNKHPQKKYQYQKNYIEKINRTLGWLIKKQGYKLQ